MPKTFVVSLGGSLICPNDFDFNFLKKFKHTILRYIKKKNKFAIICGGGKLARTFQETASRSKKLSNDELDWFGIHATKINAHLMNSMFKGYSENFIVSNPTLKLSLKKSIVITSGWKPGWSTDYVAVLLAKNLKVKEVINMSNVDYVYDKDPKKFKNAKKLEKLRWKEYIKMTGAKWKAGMNVPFDPMASKEAQSSKIRVYIIGKNLKNLENLLDNKRFKGTVIS